MSDSDVVRGAKMAVGGCAVVLLLVVLLLGGFGVLVALVQSLPPPTQTLTVEVSGDTGVPYELTYETSQGSYTQQGRVPDSYTVTLETGARSEDYLRAWASIAGSASSVSPGDDELIGVDLRLVSEDGTVLDEADMEGNVLNYSLNRVSVSVDGDDL